MRAAGVAGLRPAGRGAAIHRREHAMARVGRMVWTAGAALAGFSLAVYAGVASRDTRPTPTSTPAPPTLMYGWEQKFKIEWSVESERGTRRLRGYVTSQHG